MEFLSQTLLETTTQIVVNSNTVTAEFLMDPDVRYQYFSDAFNNDALTATIKINFDSTQTISRISLMEFNAKKFNVYYNGVTANAFTITNPTTTTQFITNSATNLYLACTSVDVTSVSFDLYSTIVANSEKAVGYVYLGANQLTFPRIPNASNYTPVRDPKEIIHELSDGGTRRQLIQTKWSTKIKFQYITESFRNSLKTIHESLNPFVYVPFGTGTSWDGILFESNWLGNFEFYKYSDDAVSSGFSGSIELKET
jgi:hypothetical protein